MNSWLHGQFTQVRIVIACGQLPWGDTQHSWDCVLWHRQQNECLGPESCIRYTVQLGQCLAHHTVTWVFGPGKRTKHIDNHGQGPCQAPKCLIGLDLRSAWNIGPTWDSALVLQMGHWDGWTQKGHVTFVSGKSNVVHPPQAQPHIPVVFVFSVLPLTTETLSNWGWIRCFHTLVQVKNQTWERLSNRRRKY